MNIRKAVLIVFFLSSGILYSQTINLRFSTYFYGWQRADSLNVNSTPKTTHIRGYQNLLLDVSKEKWGFNTLIQTDEDVIHRIDKGFNYRFYNVYLRGTNLFNLLDIRLGRQYVFAGVGKGAVDGLWLKVKTGKNKEYQLALYGGYTTPYDYMFNKYPKLKENYSAGAIFTYGGVKNLYASLSYLNRRRKLPAYDAIRLDTLSNAYTVIIDPDSRSEHYAGFDFTYSFQNKYNFYGKAFYDIAMRKLYRGEFNVSAGVAKNLNISAAYMYRLPQISYNSIFWVFEHQQSMEVEGGVDYVLPNGFNLFARVSNVFYKSTDVEDPTANTIANDKNYALRITGGFSHPSYGFSYVKYTGYAGESDGVSGYYYRNFCNNMLSTTLSAGYSRYRLGEFETTADGTKIDRINSLTAMLGFTYRPTPQISVDLQGQFLKNQIYSSDVRFLIGFNYWLFRKY
jgi:hypothetical protein